MAFDNKLIEREIMKLTREQIKAILKGILPYGEYESRFLTPNPTFSFGGLAVFDTLRELSDTPMSEDEFNNLCDEAETT